MYRVSGALGPVPWGTPAPDWPLRTHLPTSGPSLFSSFWLWTSRLRNAKGLCSKCHFIVQCKPILFLVILAHLTAI